MARVPIYDGPQATPNTLQQVAIAPVQPIDYTSRQIQQVGDAVQGAGQAAGAIALDMQAQANQVRFDAAAQQAREAVAAAKWGPQGYESLRGADALYRPDNKALPDEFGDSLDQKFKAIADGLGNDAQRRVFSKYSGDLLTSFREGAMQHVNREYFAYHGSVARGNIAQRTEEIARSGGDPTVIDRAINGRTEIQDGQVLYVEKGLRQSAYEAAKLTGASEAEANNMAQKAISNGLRLSMLDALERNDVTLADGLLKRYSKDMDAADLLAVRAHITKEMDARVGMSAAGEVVRSMQPRIQTSDAERAFNIAIGTESGGKQFAANGAPLTSPKGAIGIAQVMPGTAPEAAKLAGLDWDEDRYRNDAGYNKALGMAYFQKQLQDYAGDLTKAYAAYNAGPGRVQEAIGKAEKNNRLAANDPAIPVKKWLDFMPAETQGYVAKNMKAYEAGQGNLPRPTFQEIDDALRAIPQLASNPARYRIAREEAARQFEEQTQAIKQRDDAAVSAAMRGVLENGGRYSDLPVSLRAAVPPKDVDNVINFAQKISKGDDSTSLWLYNKLTSRPENLAKMSDDEFFALRRELSEADFKHFSAERAKLTGAAPGSTGPGDLNSQAIRQTLDNRLRMLKIDPTPKDDGGNDAARIGAIRRFIDQDLYTAQREAGKKFSDAEVAKRIDALFATNVTLSGWLYDSKGPLLGAAASDIPSAVKDDIKAAFKRRGVDSPTDAQILDAYWHWKLAGK